MTIRSTGVVLGVGLVAVAAVGGGLSMWWHAADARPALDPDDPPKTEFATGGVPAALAGVKFDAERAVKYLKQICDLGPRVSGTDGMRKQQALVEKHFQDLGATVTRQAFDGKQASRREKTPMVNLVVSWHPEAARRVLICAHYDTRPIADQEPDRGSWTRPFVSANDGASGVALMMELGHHLKDLKAGAVGLDFVLFDGEEYVFETTRTGGGDRYFIGSEHFAADHLKTRGRRKHQYEAGVLLDLFAAKGAVLKVEEYSFAAAPKLVDAIWGTAAAVGAKSFRYEAGPAVQDDHLALNKAGIPCVDVIDFDYPHWHKLTDTADKVSGEQMAEVAKVLTAWWLGLK